MQVSTLSAQLGLGEELVDWYRDATSVACGHLWIDLSPRTDDTLRYCKNSGSISSKFHIPDRLKHLKPLDDEHAKSLHSPNVPIIFPQMQKPFPSVLFIRFCLRMHSRSVQRKPAKRKRLQMAQFQARFGCSLQREQHGSKQETI